MRSIKTVKITHFSGILLALGLLYATAAIAAPAVREVSANTSSIGIYEKFELGFKVDTVAANLYWPYDTTPNAGVPAGVGVTVDGLFSKDNWATTVVQPAFIYQQFEQADRVAWLLRDWLYPVGQLTWKIRFAPTALGTWKYKIRVTDSSGTVTYTPPTDTFTCIQSNNHGFVRVSPTDKRYFEASDGTYLNFIGLSDGTNYSTDMDNLFSTYKQNGINLLRPWWQGSQGPVMFGLSGQGGVPKWRGLWVTAEAARPGQFFSGKIVSNTQVSTSVDVKPSTTYRYSVWVRTAGLQGSGDYGIYLQAFDCTQPDIPLTSKLRGDTPWTQLTANITTKSDQNVIDFLKVIVSGMSSGTAYFSDVSLRQDLGSGQYGPELLSRPNFEAHKHVSQKESWIADYQVECAKRNNIYLKVCLQEKADIVYSSIQPNGSIGPQSDDNVYAWDSHASRTYQKYFWRYMVARYGYATSIHSWEFCNEGDPFNQNHHNGTEALAKFVKQNDPNSHLVATSFWHSFPSKEFWTNSNFPNVGYGDWHQYIGQQNGNDLQYWCGWGWQAPVTFSNIARSAPNSVYINNTAGEEYLVPTCPFAITPGHTYTVKCYIKGQNLTATGSKAGAPSWIYPTVKITFKDGWWASEVGSHYPGTAGTFMGTYDWKLWTATVTAPANARYMVLQPTAHWAVGQAWFDDITLHDDTTNEDIEVPNGNADCLRLDFDTALMTKSIGTQIGAKSSRVIQAPVIRGENGISGNKVYGDIYKGSQFVGENQQLIDDTQGVWYHKFVWGQINPFGVIDMYWWRDNISRNGLYKHVRAYQAFMAGIQLSNGNYVDARASTSNVNLRAWGQKDLVNNKIHLWIDNIPSNWKNVVDGVAITPVSGTVTVSGLKSGVYKAEWWDTTTGAITRTDDVQCINGNITLQVQGLQSDTACKIFQIAATAKVDMRILTSSAGAAPGEIVTITVEATNNGETSANNVVLAARVPAEMDYIAGSAEATGGSWNATTKSATWNISAISAHTTVTKTFKAKVK